MSDEKLWRKKFIAISECDICSQLAETETSFVKNDHEDLTRLLPAAALQLLFVQDSQVSATDKRKFQWCPVCGTFYFYRLSYEFLIGGSEDEEELTRATPAQARRFLTDADYAELIEWMTICLQHPDAKTRNYAARCLVSHHLERNELDCIAQYLAHDDTDIVIGALAYLMQAAGEYYKLEELCKLQEIFTKLCDHSEQSVAKIARYIIYLLDLYAKRARLKNHDAFVEEEKTKGRNRR